MRDSKCHLIILGAEAGSEEQQTRIKKKIDLDHNLELALGRIYERGIQTGTTWIIGYPGEKPESMMATINKAASMKHKFPGSASDIFPFRAIPGTDDFNAAVELGYQPPKSFEEWGGCLEYKYEFDDIGLPLEVLETWKRYGATASFYDGHVHEGSGFEQLGRALSHPSHPLIAPTWTGTLQNNCKKFFLSEYSCLHTVHRFIHNVTMCHH